MSEFNEFQVPTDRVVVARELLKSEAGVAPIFVAVKCDITDLADGWLKHRSLLDPLESFCETSFSGTSLLDSSNRSSDLYKNLVCRPTSTREHEHQGLTAADQVGLTRGSTRSRITVIFQV